jgi:hypothetical protein
VNSKQGSNAVKVRNARFEVLASVKIEITVFCVVAPSGMVSSTLKMGIALCFETFLSDHHTERRSNPENHKFYKIRNADTAQPEFVTQSPFHISHGRAVPVFCVLSSRFFIVTLFPGVDGLLLFQCKLHSQD